MAPQVIWLFAIEVVRDHLDNIKMNRSYWSPQIEVSGSFCDASNLSVVGQGSWWAICTARTLWVRLQLSVMYMWCLYYAHGGFGAWRKAAVAKGRLKGLDGRYAPRMCCGLDHKRQWGVVVFMLCTWGSGGVVEGSEGEGEVKWSWWAIGTMRALWVGLQASVRFLLRTWRSGGAVEGGEGEGKVEGLDGRYAPQACCGLGYRCQWGLCYVRGGLGARRKAARAKGRSKGLDGRNAPCVHCGLGCRRQWCIRDVYVMHMEVWGHGGRRRGRRGGRRVSMGDTRPARAVG